MDSREKSNLWLDSIQKMWYNENNHICMRF